MKNSIFGIISLVCGIIGILLSCLVIGIVPAIAGLVLAIIGMTKKESKKGLAIAGLVCSIIGIIIFLVMWFSTDLPDTETNVDTPVHQVTTERAGGTEKSENTQALENLQTQTGLVEESAVDEAELLDWLAKNLKEDEPIELKDRDIKKIAAAGEKQFLPIWKKYVLDQISNMGEDYDRISSYTIKACSLYESVYGLEGSKVSKIRLDAETISQYMKDCKNLDKNYPFSIKEDFSFWEEEFYITKRLSQFYSDNLLGTIQKEIDSYQQTESSDWLAYNVKYVLDSPSPGDVCYVLHSDKLNPFPDAGAYRLAYYDTGKTADLKDDRGFVKTVPIYYIIENPDQLFDDLERYRLYTAVIYSCRMTLEWELGEGLYAEIEADDAEIPAMDVSGCYRTADVEYSISMYSSPEMAGVGSFGIQMVDGNMMESGEIIQIETNIYAVRTEAGIYILGFSKKDGGIVMDFYMNGEHLKSIKMSEHYQS